MTKFKLLFIFSLGALSILTTSCGDDVDCADMTEVIDQFNTLTADINAATELFNMDPAANQDAFCETNENFIDEVTDILNDYDECFDDAQRSSIQASLDNAQMNEENAGC